MSGLLLAALVLAGAGTGLITLLVIMSHHCYRWCSNGTEDDPFPGTEYQQFR